MALLWKALLFASFTLLCMIPFRFGAKQNKKDLIIRVNDFKDFKKLLRTRTNLLVIFTQSEKAASKSQALFEEVAEEMRGKATMANINCGDDKKLCKKLKVHTTSFELKHFKDGEFNKDYDRKLTVKSMVNFLMDPTGDIPWDEDPTATDVVHIDTEDGLSKLLKKDKSAALVMFYAPWCGYCKRLKPDFAAAATQVKGRANLVGIDVDKPHMMGLRALYNITGFPTLYYFEKGKLKYRYGGENSKDGIVSWLNNPKPPEEPKKEAEWAEEPSEVVHLEDDTFDSYIKENPSVLVMFYAPWCGHCKKMKPGYTEAAQLIKDQEIPGILAAVDATKHRKLAETFAIKGFPTLKYFKDGEYAFDVNEREKDKIIDFLKDPKEPPPPPEPEPSWEEVESDVVHLNEENFKPTLKKRKHALIMFYAPWCGHCKKAKPEFMAAAAKFKDDGKVMFGAVDCTTQQGVCTAHDVTGYPTFKYFNYNKNSQKYMGGREENDFVNFMRDPLSPSPSPPTGSSPTRPEEDWADIPGKEFISFLTKDTFDSFIVAQGSVLVMFYAPWCGHCRMMKPAFGQAATIIAEEKIGALAAVDATVEQELGDKFEVRGYPTLKYFKDGRLAREYSGGRSADDFVAFMRNPDAPPATPPPAQAEWSDIVSDVNHLTDASFDDFIAASRRTLVMFYAPWCGHCKKMKPDYMTAATRLKKELPDCKLAAVDATKFRDLASRFNVKGYPTLKYFEDGAFKSDYKGGRSAADLVAFFQMASSDSREEL